MQRTKALLLVVVLLATPVLAGCANQDDAEVPTSWSQLATDIMVSKYFRKAGVPQPEPGVDPIVAQRDGRLQRDENGQVRTGPERSVKQVVHRLAGCWRAWGDSQGYFDTDEDDIPETDWEDFTEKFGPDDTEETKERLKDLVDRLNEEAAGRIVLVQTDST